MIPAKQKATNHTTTECKNHLNTIKKKKVSTSKEVFEPIQIYLYRSGSSIPQKGFN